MKINEYPKLNDFVKIYNYFGEYSELGRVVHITVYDSPLAVHGIAQNNSAWIYTEFYLDLYKLEFDGYNLHDGIKVWDAFKLGTMTDIAP